MNRQIKFRGKRTDNRGWAYGYYFTTPLTAEYNIQPENGAYFDCGGIGRRHVISNCDGCVFEVIPETVGQLTGLTDKNGKEIYEGDILEAKDGIPCLLSEIYTVAFDCGCFCYTDNMHNNICLQDSNEHCVVIGNIHDNPELLT